MKSAMSRVLGVVLLSFLLSANLQASNPPLLGQKITGAVKGVLKATATVGAIALLVCSNTGCDQDRVAKMIMQVDQDGDAQVIKIGMNYDATYEINAWTGAQQAVDEINAAGGINGMAVELIARNNMKDLQTSIDLTNDLIHNEGVDALIGPEYSTQAIRTGAIANTNKIPNVTTTATNPDVGRQGEYVFQAAYTNIFQSKLLANLAYHDLGAMTAAVITETGDLYSENLSQEFITNYIANGGELVTHQRYDAGDTDFSAQLAAVQASGAEVITIPGLMPEVALLAKQARAMGIETQIIGGDGWANSADLVEVAGAAAEGVIFTSHFWSIPEVGLSQTALAFIHNHIELYGQRPISRSAMGYDAVYIILQAIDRADSLVGTDIIAEIAATKDYDGATYIAGFTPEGWPRKAGVLEEVKGGATIFKGLVRP